MTTPKKAPMFRRMMQAETIYAGFDAYGNRVWSEKKPIDWPTMGASMYTLHRPSAETEMGRLEKKISSMAIDYWFHRGVEKNGVVRRVKWTLNEIRFASTDMTRTVFVRTCARLELHRRASRKGKK